MTEGAPAAVPVPETAPREPVAADVVGLTPTEATVPPPATEAQVDGERVIGKDLEDQPCRRH